MEQGKKAYPFVCPECGEQVLDNVRYFSVQPLLNHIMLTAGDSLISIGAALEKYINVSIRFGEDVLGCPVRTVLLPLGAAKPESAQLTQLEISMESVLHQLEIQMQLERDTLIKLIDYQRAEGNLRQKYQTCYDDAKDGKTLSDEDNAFCVLYEHAYPRIMKNLRSQALSNIQVREQTMNEFLDVLVNLCNAEKNSQNSMKYQIKTAWCFAVNSTTGINVPEMLYMELADEHGIEICSSRDACCPCCHKAINKYFGVYPQKIIGVLGGQSTGKTTYMAAFADMLQHTNLDDLPFTLSYEPEGDAQWRRFQTSSKEGNFGAMWAYQNGYNAQKTDLQSESAVSLSFLVTPKSPKKTEKIPTIYVLADIPGEIFNGTEGNTVSETIQNSRKIFQYCQARLMTLSCDPKDAQIAAASYNEWISQFPKLNIPSAFLLTKFDRSQKKPAVSLAYPIDQTEYRPYVPGKNGVCVYNIDRMSTLCRYAKQQEDLLSPNLFTNLLNAMQTEQPDASEIALNAFLLNSGTANYIDYTTVDDEEKQKERVSVARTERYGIMAPILWLLALDGYIDPGCRKDEMLTFSAAAEEQLQKLWKRELYRPEGVD